MNKSPLFFIFLSVVAGLNIGTVRKAEDPIRDTQTNPILYEQKKEEEKDGKKGPLMYNVKYNPREKFFIDPPIETEKKASASKTQAGQTSVAAENAGWWEEQPTTPSGTSSAGSVSEPLPESVPKQEKMQGSEAPGGAASDAGNTAPTGKGDDYWW